MEVRQREGSGTVHGLSKAGMVCGTEPTSRQVSWFYRSKDFLPGPSVFVAASNQLHTLRLQSTL